MSKPDIPVSGRKEASEFSYPRTPSKALILCNSTQVNWHFRMLLWNYAALKWWRLSPVPIRNTTSSLLEIQVIKLTRLLEVLKQFHPGLAALPISEKALRDGGEEALYQIGTVLFFSWRKWKHEPPPVVRKKKQYVCLNISSASAWGINLLGARDYCVILIKQKLSFVLPDPEEMTTYFCCSLMDKETSS